MPILLPPPPKSRGIVGLLLTLALVGWTGYLLFDYANKKPVSKPIENVVDSGPTFVEIDLRGPKFEVGRYAGYQKGLEAKGKGFSQPAANVLRFSAQEAAKAESIDANETDDFTAGYEAGYTLAMKPITPPAAPVSDLQK